MNEVEAIQETSTAKKDVVVLGNEKLIRRKITIVDEQREGGERVRAY